LETPLNPERRGGFGNNLPFNVESGCSEWPSCEVPYRVEFVNARPSKRRIPGGGLLVPVLQCGDVVVTESEVRPLHCTASSFFTRAGFPSSYRTCYPTSRRARVRSLPRQPRVEPRRLATRVIRVSFLLSLRLSLVSLVSPSALALHVLPRWCRRTYCTGWTRTAARRASRRAPRVTRWGAGARGAGGGVRSHPSWRQSACSHCMKHTRRLL
jgi:hypothetical protein